MKKLKLIVLLICVITVSCKSEKAKEEVDSKTISLFNGKNLDNWRGDARVWSVEEGSIVGRTTDEIKIDKNTFLIYESSFSDFELNLKYKIVGGNSGIQYRAKVLGEDDFAVAGYQADMEAGIQYSGILYEENGRGIMALRGEKITINEDGKKTVEQFEKSENIQAIINQDQWNNYRIVAKENHLQHFINGKKTIDVIDREISKKSDGGVIALQVHKGPNMVVYFKDIIIKPAHGDIAK
ncbi:3-keto-disaccharide hydrolase [Aureibaculum conchae]|uniref:3-keto-disaccharide hydrolase n=1 Tax=Aureibaculum sp. 2308TA14-22 TaxID=3108392 RepID=UPI0033967E3F